MQAETGIEAGEGYSGPLLAITNAPRDRIPGAFTSWKSLDSRKIDRSVHHGHKDYATRRANQTP